MIKYLVKMILKQMIYIRVYVPFGIRAGPQQDWYVGNYYTWEFIFFIFLMRSLWKYYGSKIVMSDVQSSFQNSDGLALSSMGHKINIEII